MNKKLFGILPSGKDVYIYQISEGTFTAEIMEQGAAIVSLCPFGNVDVVGRFDTLEHYLTDTSYQGAIVEKVPIELKVHNLNRMAKHINSPPMITATACIVVLVFIIDF